MLKNLFQEEGNGTQKLSYLNNLWMYFDEIIDRFKTNRNKIKTIIKIFETKNLMEKNYSSSIKKLCDEYCSKYNDKDEIKTPYQKAINRIIDCFKEETQLIDERIKNISSYLIIPINNFIKSQLSISEEMIKIKESSKNEFKLINQILREKEINLMKIGKDLESSMYKLETENLVRKKKDDEKNQNNLNEIIPNEIDNNKNALIESCQKKKELNIKKAKAIKFEYESFIKIANEEREKYISITSKIYNEFQILDEKYISKIKDTFKVVFEKEINFINKYLEINTNYLNKYINIIDIDKEMSTFINSKIIKFKIPEQIECLYYSPQTVLKNRNDPIKRKITAKINNELNELFIENKKNEEKGKNEVFNFLKNCISLILDEKNYDKEKLMKLLENNENRKKFFEYLNQYRIEGIFSLTKKTFDDLCFLFNYLIQYLIKDKDFDSFKSLIILSQTFYLNNNKNLFINASIVSHDIWKKKEFWEEIILYCINDELNNSRDFYLYLEDDSNCRKVRINSVITSNIITYIYNMKLFNYPEDKYKELIDDLINKLKIDGANIYATLSSINDEIKFQNNVNKH